MTYPKGWSFSGAPTANGDGLVLQFGAFRVLTCQVFGFQRCCQVVEVGSFQESRSVPVPPKVLKQFAEDLWIHLVNDARGGAIATVSDNSPTWLALFANPKNGWKLLREYPAVADGDVIYIYWLDGNDEANED